MEIGKNAEMLLDEMEQQGLSLLYPDKVRIAVGLATCGRAAGGKAIYEALEDEAARLGLDVMLVATGCLGFCQKEPLVSLLVPGQGRVTYAGVDGNSARLLVRTLAGGAVYREKILGVEHSDVIFNSGRVVELGASPAGRALGEVPFFKKQLKLVTRNCGYIDPGNIYEYAGRGGYRALIKALRTGGDAVLEEVAASGLRGRGGAGFPTGLKWRAVRRAGPDLKYVICNADEGDPGAYMDRSILEGDPHSVIEGMIIGAYAMGASCGIIYVRAEYPLAVRTLQNAVSEARRHNFLGENILGTAFSFDLQIVKGAGAFVCGEETALLSSIEGLPGVPRPRPPFPAERGLWGRPTCINNVETWANIPLIILRGAGWYAGLGTEKSKGTKVFSLVGNVRNNGLVEVPMGVPLKDIVLEAGGGCPGGLRLKAVQTGGPSGGCVPAGLLDVPVDYESLSAAGTIMGSGGMVVMDERTCMVDVARYFLSFVQEESCGKCLPCREGTRRVLDILTRITDGAGEVEDLAELEEISTAVKESSLCGLGQTACNPVLSTLKYFRGEYLSHVLDKHCPAGVCKNLTVFFIDPGICTGCGLCARECPAGAVSGEPKKPHRIESQKCVKCRYCFENCPSMAVRVAERNGA